MVTLNEIEDVEVIHHIGLSHYYFGNPKRGLKKFITKSPSEISPKNNPAQAGGDLSLPGPEDALLDLSSIFYENDAYHYGEQANINMVQHIYDIYLEDIYEELNIEKAQ